MSKHFYRFILVAVFTTAQFGVASVAHSQTRWDFATAWPATNFHAKNAQAFADAVGKATNGELRITVHTGGQIGVKAGESLSAVEANIVQMADMLMLLQAGVEPDFGIDALPYLIQGQGEMREFLEHADPLFRKLTAKHNQKILYYVPWPSPGVYSKRKIESLADIKGQKIRAFNGASFEFLNGLGAAALQMPWGEVVTALAAGTVDGVATSTSSGVDGKLWQFTKHFNPMNWSTSTDVVTVNLDAWNKLTDAQRTAVETVAREMQPKFWAVSADEDASKLEILKKNGITVSRSDAGLRAKMKEVGTAMWPAFYKKAPQAQAVIEAYVKALGK